MFFCLFVSPVIKKKNIEAPFLEKKEEERKTERNQRDE